MGIQKQLGTVFLATTIFSIHCLYAEDSSHSYKAETAVTTYSVQIEAAKIETPIAFDKSELLATTYNVQLTPNKDEKGSPSYNAEPEAVKIETATVASDSIQEQSDTNSYKSELTAVKEELEEVKSELAAGASASMQEKSEVISYKSELIAVKEELKGVRSELAAVNSSSMQKKSVVLNM